MTIKCLEYLNDEYSKTNLTIPLFAPKSKLFKKADGPMSDSIRVVNIALTYCSLVEQSSLFLPLSTMSRWRYCDTPREFPFVQYKPDNAYETAAILATYFDTISLRYRLRDPVHSGYLSGFCSDLNNYGRKLAAAGLGIYYKNFTLVRFRIIDFVCSFAF